MSATTMRSGNRQQQQQQPGKRNILSNAAYSIFVRSSDDYARHGPAAGTAAASANGSLYLQRSTSADNVQIVRQRGFKPSDRHDPAKRTFLESLTSKILHFDMDSASSSPMDLQKLLTPAPHSSETLQLRNKKMYASSCFYAPSHPTVEDQVELARRISSSLSDVKNVKSKGQSMYVNRKKRSVKWIHDGNGLDDEDEPSAPTRSKDKVPLKCMMNPNGKLLDYRGIQALGEEPNIPQVPPHPERLYDIVRDLNNQKGRGAEIFAKRRKRSEKWVVDASEQPQSASIYASYGRQQLAHERQLPPTDRDFDCLCRQQDIASSCANAVDDHSKFDNRAFYDPFDLSMDYSSPLLPSYGQQCSRASFGSAHSECGGGGRCRPYGTGPYPPLYPPACMAAYPRHHDEHRLRKKKPEPSGDKLLRRASFDGQQQQAARNGFSYLNGPEPRAALGQRQRSRACRPRETLAGDRQPGPEDYTPVPVKQLIQEFEKTCRPVMQFGPPALKPSANGHGDLSRYFDWRRQACYAHSSAGDDEEEEEEEEEDGDSEEKEEDEGEEEEDDDDDEASLDDSLSPVDFYRAEAPQTNGHASNRSSSMSTVDDYYRRQLQQTANLDQAQIAARRKDLKKTPVLENLVAGTTTPECFKDSFAQDIATKLADNLYHGPKISSYQNLANYNTAPRGWDQSQKVYRPIRFEKPQDTKISYSDF